MNRTTGAAVLALACSAALTRLRMSGRLRSGGSVCPGERRCRFKVPGGWQARDLDGTVLLTPKGDDGTSAHSPTQATTQLGSSSQGANYLTVTGVQQYSNAGASGCGASPSAPTAASGPARSAWNRRRLCAVRADFAQGSGDDFANTAEAGPPAVDLLKKIVDGEIVTADDSTPELATGWSQPYWIWACRLVVRALYQYRFKVRRTGH